MLKANSMAWTCFGQIKQLTKSRTGENWKMTKIDNRNEKLMKS